MNLVRRVTVQELCKYLEDVFPLAIGEDWDNLGLLLGDVQCEVNRVLTCLTLTPDVADEAIEMGASVIVTHHPILFKPVKRLNTLSIEGQTLLKLSRHSIAVYSSHTAYDNAPSGINQQLSELLELSEIAPLRPFAVPDSMARPLAKERNGQSCLGAGRYGRLAKSHSLSDFVEFVANRLNQQTIQFVGDPSQKIETVGIACGAAAEFLGDAYRVGCQAFLTGEARFHACLEARQLNLALVLPGHYATERPAMEEMARRLTEYFPGIPVTASKREHDPLVTYSVSAGTKTLLT